MIRDKILISTALVLLLSTTCDAGRKPNSPWLLISRNETIKATKVQFGKDGESFIVTTGPNNTRTIPFRSCVALMQKGSEPADYPTKLDTRCRIELFSGETLLGADLRYDGKKLSFSHPPWGETTITSENLFRISFVPRDTTTSGAENFTGIRFRNGDRVEGRIDSIAKEIILLEVKDVGKLPVRGFAAIADIIFAPPGQAAKRRASSNISASVAVLLRSGDIIFAVPRGGEGDEWTLQPFWRDEPLKVQALSIRSIVFLEKNRFLSDLEPTRTQLTPFMNYIMPWRRNRSLDGSTLSLRGYRATKGFSMHTRTELEFRIDGIGTNILKFCALVGIDDSAITGDADLVIRVDGNELKRERIVSSKEPTVIFVDVPAGSKRFTIVADYGRRGSAGDHVNILWAVLDK